MGEIGAEHFEAVGQQESPLKLPCRYAAVQELALFIVILAPFDEELLVLDRDLDIARGRNPRPRA